MKFNSQLDASNSCALRDTTQLGPKKKQQKKQIRRKCSPQYLFVRRNERQIRPCFPSPTYRFVFPLAPVLNRNSSCRCGLRNTLKQQCSARPCMAAFLVYGGSVLVFLSSYLLSSAAFSLSAFCIDMPSTGQRQTCSHGGVSKAKNTPAVCAVQEVGSLRSGSISVSYFPRDLSTVW